VEGSTNVINQLASTLAAFTPDFEILPGTKPSASVQETNPYEVGPVELRGE
jgi:hypothetical protein